MSLPSHTCQGVVLHCIDFRFRKQLAEFLRKRFPNDDYDLIAVAGGVKGLVGKGDDSRFLLNQLDTSHRLHHPSVMVLIQHEDCGAYGGSAALGSFEQELVFQKGQLRAAAAALKSRFPEASVETYLIRLSGEVVSADGEGLAPRETSVLQKTP